jgi:hypothetical protein
MNRQGLMKNIALYDGATNQLDAISMDSSLHTSADGQFFRDDVALNLCAIVDQNGRGVEFALDASGLLSINSSRWRAGVHAAFFLDGSGARIRVRKTAAVTHATGRCEPACAQLNQRCIT